MTSTTDTKFDALKIGQKITVRFTHPTYGTVEETTYTVQKKTNHGNIQLAYPTGGWCTIRPGFFENPSIEVIG